MSIKELSAIKSQIKSLIYKYNEEAWTAWGKLALSHKLL